MERRYVVNLFDDARRVVGVVNLTGILVPVEGLDDARIDAGAAQGEMQTAWL